MTAGPILVTGGGGQLASALAAAGSRRLLVVGRPRFDFDHPATLPDLLRELAPSLIINAAAHTAVDRAETEPESAARANRDGPALLAEYCARTSIPLLHISTDYVFDGLKGAPYLETDPTSPTCVYGATKLAGEQAVLAACPRAIVLRTSWVYAAAGKNFVLTMLRLGAERDALSVVADQIGCPTAAPDLAAAILGVVDRIGETGWRDDYAGVFHAAGTGSVSWHGFAAAIFAAAARNGARSPTLRAITTAEYPTAARRPPDSRLDCGKLACVFGLQLPPWRAGLDRVVDEVFRAQHERRASSIVV